MPIEPHRTEIKRLRDKREHVTEYYQGHGRFPADWWHEDGDGSADASSLIGTKIGGRLDYKVVCEALAKVVAALPKM